MTFYLLTYYIWGVFGGGMHQPKSTVHENVSSALGNDLNTLKMIISERSMNRNTFNKFVNYVFEYQSPTCFREPYAFMTTFTIWMSLTLRFVLNVVKTTFAIFLVFIVVYVLATNHNPTQKFITRNSQSYIYPVMRGVRLWSLPIIRRYHSLTDWHEEDCLMKNPFYQEHLLDCWPCEDVRTMVDLTGLLNYSRAYVYNEKPFLARDVMESTFTLNDLMQLFKQHSTKLERGTARFSSSHPSLQSLSNFFQGIHSLTSMEKFHILWKVNRVAAARVLRKAFKRPYFIPNNSEVALQRYLCISGSEAPQFVLPTTDFANVWIAQGQGYRLIVLDPSDSCQNNCSTLSVLLRPKDVLYYNWQFWKPRSLPARLSEDASVTYIGSFY